MATKSDLPTVNSSALNDFINGTPVPSEKIDENFALSLSYLNTTIGVITDQMPQTGVATTYTTLQTFNVDSGTNPDIAVNKITSAVTNGNIQVIPDGTGKLFYGSSATASNEVSTQLYVAQQVAAAATVTGIIMTGASGGADGVAGAVPKPLAGYNTRFLRGDGTWVSLNLPTFPSGTVVGTTDNQTLTNKTMSGASNNFSNILTSSIAIASRTGNGSQLASVEGALTNGNLTSWNSAGNLVDSTIAAASLAAAQKSPVTAKGTSVSVTSSTTLATITGMSVAVTTGKTYAFKVFVPYNVGGAGPGIRLAVNGPSSTGIAYFFRSSITTSATVFSSQRTAFGSSGQLALAAGSMTNSVDLPIFIEGVFTTTASGSFVVQFCQDSSSGTATTISEGAMVTVQETT